MYSIGLYSILSRVLCTDCKVVYYHGDKASRNQMLKEQVETITFNVLVTTYEFIMYDAKQLCKMQWKYLVIDEAQRMKDRDSKLSKAFDKFSFEKRLLLTGTLHTPLLLFLLLCTFTRPPRCLSWPSGV